MKFFVKESTTAGLWHFEETSGTTHSDGSGNDYTLTDVSAPTRITTTSFGGGLSFNGSTNYTERNGGGANLDAANVTVEMLVMKPSPHSGDIDAICANYPRGAAADGRGWDLLVLANGTTRFRTGSGSGSFEFVDDSIPLPLDRWVYLAATHDGTNNRLYRCGNLVGGPTAVSAISYAASPSANADTYKTFMLGAVQGNDAGPPIILYGKFYIADLRVSNTAKSDSDIYNEQRIQQYCESEPAVPIPGRTGGGMSLPFAPYQRYKSIRAAVAQYNNLVLGP